MPRCTFYMELQRSIVFPVLELSSACKNMYAIVLHIRGLKQMLNIF